MYSQGEVCNHMYSMQSALTVCAQAYVTEVTATVCLPCAHPIVILREKKVDLTKNKLLK